MDRANGLSYKQNIYNSAQLCISFIQKKKLNASLQTYTCKCQFPSISLLFLLAKEHKIKVVKRIG